MSKNMWISLAFFTGLIVIFFGAAINLPQFSIIGTFVCIIVIIGIVIRSETNLN